MAASQITPFRRRALLLGAALFNAFSLALLAPAQTADPEANPPPGPPPDEQNASGPAQGPGAGDQSGSAAAVSGTVSPTPGGTSTGQAATQRRNFNRAEIRDRMLASLREQMDVKEDAEWLIISERIQKVFEARVSNMSGLGMMMFAGRRGPNAPQGRGLQANPEAEALQAAIKNNAPAAELKARLERLRDARKENDAKLAKVQDSLREVLNLRQEAVAVMVGLLP